MTFLDLFAGIGGFRLGMEQAGYICVGHCEIDKFANKSYIAMHKPKGSEWYADDITRIRAEDVPRADCWCFGFPCQDISVAGKQQGFRGHRSSLFFTVTSLIRGQKEEDKPSYLFIENVKNLLSVNRGRDFASVLMELDEIGYDSEWAVINSADVIPQNRERVFIIGHLRRRSTRKVFPIGEKGGMVADKITGLQDSCHIAVALRATDYKGTHNVILYQQPKLKLFGLINGENKVQSRIYHAEGICPALNTGTGGNLEPKVAYNADKNGNEHCIDANYYRGILSHQKRTGVYDGVRVRRLTPRECFRLQGFPDEYFDRAQAVNSDRQLYKQAGNSVTVPVIYEIAKRMKIGG